MTVPHPLHIYHIVHIDRLASVLEDGYLWSHAEIIRRGSPGTTIGMNNIKERRLALPLPSFPNLMVGGCVPFYFCPRSVMLYIINRRDHVEVDYKGGQGPIIHLQSDFYRTVQWAQAHGLRWAFTKSNAGARYFEDFTDMIHLSEVSWNAVQARQWSALKEGKQAEFLIESQFPWELVEKIGVQSLGVAQATIRALQNQAHKPPVHIMPDWYY